MSRNGGSLFGGFSSALAARVVAMGLGLLFRWIITRHVTIEDFAAFGLAMVLADIVGILFMGIDIDSPLTRDGIDSLDARRRILGTILLVKLAIGAGTIALFVPLSGWIGLTPLERHVALTLLGSFLLTACAGSFHASFYVAGRIQTVNLFLVGTQLLTFTGGFLALNAGGGVSAVAAVMAAAQGIQLLAAWIWSSRLGTAPTIPRHRGDVRFLLGSARVMSLHAILSKIFLHVDVLVLRFFAIRGLSPLISENRYDVYMGIRTLLFSFMSIPRSYVPIVYPRLARAAREGTAKLAALHGEGYRFLGAGGLALFAVCMTVPGSVLGLLEPEYAGGSWALGALVGYVALLFLDGQTGPTSFVLRRERTLSPGIWTRTVAAGILLPLVAAHGGPAPYAWTYTGIYTLYVLWAFGMLKRVMPEFRPVADLARPVAAGGFAAAVALAGERIGMPPVGTLSVALLLWFVAIVRARLLPEGLFRTGEPPSPSAVDPGPPPGAPPAGPGS